MSLKVGIVGLPNVGKSTLFNALLKKRVALSANYPFATVEPNVGIVAVPDERLGKLAQLVKDEEKLDHFPPIVPAVVEFVDIAGLVKGASKGEGLGNQFLGHIREVDAIVHVLRDFEDENVARAGSENPKSDREVVETELALSDLQTIGKLVENQEKVSRIQKDEMETGKYLILTQLKKDLEAGKKLSEFEVDDIRLKDWVQKLPLLSLKPVLYVYNIDEKRLTVNSLQTTAKLAAESGEQNTISICAKLEEELADYSEEERIEYLKSVGVEKTGLERLIVKAYQLLDLISFLTAGEKEVRAWTVKTGTKAPVAAGVIHTDFSGKFIRAEVCEYQKLVDTGSFKTAKDKGLIRIEGKDYEIADGDVVYFRIGN